MQIHLLRMGLGTARCRKGHLQGRQLAYLYFDLAQSVR